MESFGLGMSNIPVGYKPCLGSSAVFSLSTVGVVLSKLGLSNKVNDGLAV